MRAAALPCPAGVDGKPEQDGESGESVTPRQARVSLKNLMGLTVQCRIRLTLFLAETRQTAADYFTCTLFHNVPCQLNFERCYGLVLVYFFI